MPPHRRLTDRAPFADVVSRANLDDRLASVNQKIDGLQVLANERWEAHKGQHDELAQSLRDYKSESNEWRATLSDLRLTFIPKAEAESESRALEAQVTGLINTNSTLISTLDGRLDTVERAIQSISDRQLATRSVFADSRNVLATAGVIFGAVASAILIFDRLHP